MSMEHLNQAHQTYVATKVAYVQALRTGTADLNAVKTAKKALNDTINSGFETLLLQGDFFDAYPKLYAYTQRAGEICQQEKIPLCLPRIWVEPQLIKTCKKLKKEKKKARLKQVNAFAPNLCTMLKDWSQYPNTLNACTQIAQCISKTNHYPSIYNSAYKMAEMTQTTPVVCRTWLDLTLKAAKALKSDNHIKRIYIERARIDLQSQQWPKVIDALDQVASLGLEGLDPECQWEVCQMQIQALQTCGQNQSSCQWLLKSLAYANTQARQNITQANLAKIYYDLSQNTEAQKALDQIQNPNAEIQASMDNLQGLIHMDQGHPSEAMACFEKILKDPCEDGPHLGDVCLNLGDAHAQLHQNIKAQEAYAQAAIHYGAGTYGFLESAIRMISAQRQQGQYQAALAGLTKLPDLTCYPELNANCQTELGHIHRAQGHLDDALRAYQQARGMMKTPESYSVESIKIHRHIADIYNQKKQHDKAITQYKTLIDMLRTKDQRHQLCLTLHNAALCLIDAGEDATAYLQEAYALSLQEENFKLCAHICLSLSEKKPSDLAIKHLTQALAHLKTMHPYGHLAFRIRYQLAGHLIKQNRYEEAHAQFTDILAADHIHLKQNPKLHPFDFRRHYEAIASELATAIEAGYDAHRIQTQLLSHQALPPLVHLTLLEDAHRFSVKNELNLSEIVAMHQRLHRDLGHNPPFASDQHAMLIDLHREWTHILQSWMRSIQDPSIALDQNERLSHLLGGLANLMDHGLFAHDGSSHRLYTNDGDVPDDIHRQLQSFDPKTPMEAWPIWIRAWANTQKHLHLTQHHETRTLKEAAHGSFKKEAIHIQASYPRLALHPWVLGLILDPSDVAPLHAFLVTQNIIHAESHRVNTMHALFCTSPESAQTMGAIKNILNRHKQLPDQPIKRTILAQWLTHQACLQSHQPCPDTPTIAIVPIIERAFQGLQTWLDAVHGASSTPLQPLVLPTPIALSRIMRFDDDDTPSAEHTAYTTPLRFAESLTMRALSLSQHLIQLRAQFEQRFIRHLSRCFRTHPQQSTVEPQFNRVQITNLLKEKAPIKALTKLLKFPGTLTDVIHTLSEAVDAIKTRPKIDQRLGAWIQWTNHLKHQGGACLSEDLKTFTIDGASITIKPWLQAINEDLEAFNAPLYVVGGGAAK